MGVILFQGRIVILDDKGLKEMLIEEGHKSGYSLHSGITRMCQDLRSKFGDQG
jgi:hypothetical protein